MSLLRFRNRTIDLWSSLNGIILLVTTYRLFRITHFESIWCCWSSAVESCQNCTAQEPNSGAGVAQRQCNRLPRDGPGFDSLRERCIYRTSLPSQGSVNGCAVSKWPRCRWYLKHNQQEPIYLGILIFFHRITASIYFRLESYTRSIVIIQLRVHNQ